MLKSVEVGIQKRPTRIKIFFLVLFYPLCVWLQLSFRHPSYCISCDVSLSVSTLSSPVSLFYLVPCFTLSLTFHCNWHFCNVLLSNNSQMLSTDILLFTVPLRSHSFLQGLLMTCIEMHWFLLFVCNNFITTFSNDLISWILPHFHLEPDAIRCCWAQGKLLLSNCLVKAKMHLCDE